ncbi:MAG: DUF3006 domain-containing protein [Ruminococcaceae bacterium]|nr:DUF3006 domain-containing protein [Oscillospiraceae bacterium]
MKYVADRIENGYALLVNADNDSVINVPTEELGTLKEGDVFLYEEGRYRRLEKETESRKESLAERFNKLKNK